MNAPPKVTNLEFAIDSDEEIFRFNITVDYVFGMEVDESVGHLVDVNGTSSFGKATILHELFVHLTLARKFKHEEDTVLVVEVTVEAKNIGMPKVLLDLYFASNLFLNPRLHDLLLVEALKGKNVVGFGLGPNHVNMPKSAFTQRATNVKVIQMPVTGRPFSVRGVRINRQGLHKQGAPTLNN